MQVVCCCGTFRLGRKEFLLHPSVSNKLPVAVGVLYTYKNCNGGRNYILRSNAVRHTELQVIVGRAVESS